MIELPVGKMEHYYIKVDDRIADLLKGKALYSQPSGFKAKIPMKNGKIRNRSIPHIVLNIPFKDKHIYTVRFRDNDQANIQEDNLYKVTRAEINAENKYDTQHTYRGVYTDKHNLNNTWYAKKEVKGITFSLKAYSEKEAATLFDALSDYLGVEGVRNNTGMKRKLTIKEKNYIDNRIKIGKRRGE